MHPTTQLLSESNQSLCIRTVILIILNPDDESLIVANSHTTSSTQRGKAMESSVLHK